MLFALRASRHSLSLRTMELIQVINGDRDGWVGQNRIYVGRANPRRGLLQSSPLANPFHIGKDGDRPTVVQKYRTWLNAEITKGMRGEYSRSFEELKRIRDKVLAGEKVKLACYCFPKECHASVVKEQVEKMVAIALTAKAEKARLTQARQSMQPINQTSNLKIVQQDLLSVEQGVIVQQVNCRHVMGRGLAQAIKEKWPVVEDAYRRKQWKLGDVQLVQVSSSLYIANVAGQDGYGTDKRYTDYDALRTGLRRVNAWATQKGKQIHIPAGIGCGLGGGNWDVVQDIIQTECPNAIICSKEPLRHNGNLSHAANGTLPEKVLTVTFTGNRPQKFRDREEQEKTIQALSLMIDRAITRACELGYSKISFISGVAPGVDTWGANLVMKLARQRQDITVELIAAVPCKTFPSVWPADHKQDYERIIKQANFVHYVSDRPYSNPQQLHKRNEWMCDQLTGSDDLVLAVHNGSAGGTQKCIDYAVRLQKAIVVYEPRTKKFTRLGNWSREATRIIPKQPSCKPMDYER